MNLHNNRIEKLLNAVRPLAEMKRRSNRTARLKGATMEAICNAVANAVAEADQPILEAIAEQIKNYAKARPDDLHGFTQWLFLLRDGAAALPDRIPRSVLVAWRDRYVSEWGLRGEPWCPHPFWRCEDCRMALPHGDGGWDAPCPLCGSARIFHADFSRALGVAWIDPRPIRRLHHGA